MFIAVHVATNTGIAVGPSLSAPWLIPILFFGACMIASVTNIKHTHDFRIAMDDELQMTRVAWLDDACGLAKLPTLANQMVP